MDSPAARLSRLIQHPTVSNRDLSLVSWEAFAAFRQTLADLYPGVHRVLRLELVDGHSMLYNWKGKTTGAPVVLMAHYDVVPAPSEGWTHPPFSGALAGGKIWGRGTLDTKGSLAAVLEAVEGLVAEGFVPDRDVYLAFGHNEEVSGTGAAAIARQFAAKGLVPFLVVDEGGAVVQGAFPGVREPMAVVGVAEKGTSDFLISAPGAGGHASAPPRNGPAVRLARALVRLEARPFPARLPAPVVTMLKICSRSMPLVLKLIFGNLWLTGPLVRFLFTRLGGETNAMVRTTVAVTRLEGSKADNVLPARALANLNVRINVGETVAGTLARLKASSGDPGLSFEVVQAGEPSRVSVTEGPAWDLLSQAIVTAHPGALVVPYVMLAGSDSRHWSPFCPTVYRFSPFPLSKTERESIHAVDEALPVESLEKGILFYRTLLVNLK